MTDATETHIARLNAQLNRVVAEHAKERRRLELTITRLRAELWRVKPDHPDALAFPRTYHKDWWSNE